MIRGIGLSGGAAQPIINKSTFSAVQIDVSERVTQDAIADILSAYDDLIENNRRRIALLEQAARELYREWFVRLRFPGHENTRIVDGLPEGWERRLMLIYSVRIRVQQNVWAGGEYRHTTIKNVHDAQFFQNAHQGVELCTRENESA